MKQSKAPLFQFQIPNLKFKSQMNSSLYMCIIIDYFCGIFVGSDIFLASHLAISILISLAVGTHVVPKGDTLGPKPSLDFLE